jgi:hypothetical protein
MGLSEVMSVRSLTRAVATMSRSAGSGGNHVSADLGSAGEAADETSAAGGLGRDGHELRHLPIPVEDDDGLSTGRAADELARSGAELANSHPFHD